MISVSDRQLRVVAVAADLLPVEARGTFLQRVTAELRGHRDFSDCDVEHRCGGRPGVRRADVEAGLHIGNRRRNGQTIQRLDLLPRVILGEAPAHASIIEARSGVAVSFL